MSHHPRSARAITVAACTLIAASAHAQTPELDTITRLQSARTACLATKDAKKQASCLDAIAAEALALADRLAPRPKPEPVIDPETASINAFVSKARQLLIRDFKDPDSVKVRDAFVSKLHAGYAMCGEVNAKNSYGAYGGYRRFWVRQEPFEYRVDDQSYDKSARFVEQWRYLCSARVADAE